MSQQLINRSADLKLLREEGYDIEIRSGHLLLKSVPYVDANRQARRGTLVAPLGDMSGETVNKPGDHTAFFQGEHPCKPDGSIIGGIVHSTEAKSLGRGVFVNHMFSAKPKEGNYRDFHHKMVTYVGILGGPAQTIEPGVTAQTGNIVEPPEDESPLCYLDSSSTRAGIMAVTQKLEARRLGIVGVGGTGSYILDLVSKTPVAEIHIFDGDAFSNHNAFRSPGAASLDELRARPLKVEYLRNHYSRMHRKIVPHDVYLDDTNVELLRTLDFIFLCLDRGSDKRPIVDKLEEWNKPFIDVGMGVDLAGDTLRGSLRVTTRTAQKHDHVRKRVPFSDGGVENDYSRNIQIAELNALNAALAVIKWKKLCGYYQDLDQEHCCVYTINGNQLLNEDRP